MNIWQKILDFFYPRKCPVCNNFLPYGKNWCKFCLEKNIFFRKIPISKNEIKYINCIYAIGYYDKVLGKMIKDLKYKKHKYQVLPLQELVSIYLSKIDLSKIQMAFFIPLHVLRYRERGFNQVELIFKDYILDKNIEIGKINRCINTKKQYRLSSKERQLNLKNAFLLEKTNVNNKHCLILDDVLTSGATVLECAKILKKHGAKSVTVIVLASNRE